MKETSGHFINKCDLIHLEMADFPHCDICS
jgi:hypothetical protein